MPLRQMESLLREAVLKFYINRFAEFGIIYALLLSMKIKNLLHIVSAATLILTCTGWMLRMII